MRSTSRRPKRRSGRGSRRPDRLFRLASLPFCFEPEGALHPEERAALQDLADASDGPAAGPAFRIVLERRKGVEAGTPTAEAARVSWGDGLCRLEHDLFEAEVDVLGGRARIRRTEGPAIGLITTLRIALSGGLPVRGGLVIHAAGMEHEGRGLVFFGPSGIGKTTLATRSPWPMLSDELVALLPRGAGEAYRVSGTAFRRPVPGSRAPAVADPKLLALVELAQGPGFELEKLDPPVALRRLLGSITVPPGPPLWTAALAVVGGLVRDVPCYRMAWSLDESPFEPLASALGLSAVLPDSGGGGSAERLVEGL